MNSWLASSNKPGMSRAAQQRIEDDPMAHAAQIASPPTFLAFNFDQVLGLALVAGLPALFWAAAIFVAFASFGVALSLTAVGGIGVGIFAFLGVIFRALSHNKN